MNAGFPDLRSLARCIVLALPLVLLYPAPARAQFGIESLVLDHITDVSFSFACWDANSEHLREEGCPSEKSGYGVEVLWSVTSIPLGANPGGETTFKWNRTEKEEHFAANSRDSTIHYTIEEVPPADPRSSIGLELAIGYSQFSAFESSNPAFEIQGLVREIPSVSLYGTLDTDRLWRFKPYIGFRTGLIQLHDVQIFTPTATTQDSLVVYSGSGQAFQLGALAGLAVELHERFHVFWEGTYQLRRIPSVKWSGGGNIIPATLPRVFDFSGPSASFGLQVTVGEI